MRRPSELSIAFTFLLFSSYSGRGVRSKLWKVRLAQKHDRAIFEQSQLHYGRLLRCVEANAGAARQGVPLRKPHRACLIGSRASWHRQACPVQCWAAIACWTILDIVPGRRCVPSAHPAMSGTDATRTVILRSLWCNTLVSNWSRGSANTASIQASRPFLFFRGHLAFHRPQNDVCP